MVSVENAASLTGQENIKKRQIVFYLILFTLKFKQRSTQS